MEVYTKATKTMRGWLNSVNLKVVTEKVCKAAEVGAKFVQTLGDL
jgi:hypothetical protein